MDLSVHTSTELCALTDSLTSRIRWRMRDYESILRAELAMLAAPEPGRSGSPQRPSQGT
jgi:hypothetical protein